jgi:hypothetical protein
MTQPLGSGAGVIVTGLGVETDSGSAQQESNGKRTEHGDSRRLMHWRKGTL